MNEFDSDKASGRNRRRTDTVESGEEYAATPNGLWTARRVSPDGSTWRSLLDACEHLVFHEPCWARVTERGFDAESWAIALECDGVAVGGLLGFVFRSLWTKHLYLSYPYGGVIGQAPGDGELARLLTEASREGGVSRIRLTEYPGLPPLGLEGFDAVQMRTHILDFDDSDFDTIWTGFKARVRRDVRKAERSGVVVRAAANGRDIATFYRLYLDSMERNQALAKYSHALVTAIFEELAPQERRAILLAEREGEALAGIVVVDSAETSHYLLGGSTSSGLQYCPNDLLLNAAIRRAVEKGLGQFDFLPSGADDRALERFKAKWGASPRDLTVYSAATQPLRMAAWEAAYRVAETRVVSAALRAARGSG